MDYSIGRLVWFIGIMIGVYSLARLCALMELPKPAVRIIAASCALITLLITMLIVGFNSQLR